ncbi:hypothetical protein HFO06_30190 [Rhizobium leguminosarum]|uniref:hypothetical protein n=1 Tax=Rhizobium leguminosarum TaxID=384 RepID=UPI001C976348|nr:hypothetical protein [Rhizobium leguminosarum]MBY5767307.1 hypothetical protein [Rhizobium leguminosarum]
MAGNIYMRRVLETYPDFDVDKWLSIVPFKEQWQKEQYREEDSNASARKSDWMSEKV